MDDRLASVSDFVQGTTLVKSLVAYSKVGLDHSQARLLAVGIRRGGGGGMVGTNRMLRAVRCILMAVLITRATTVFLRKTGIVSSGRVRDSCLRPH